MPTFEVVSGDTVWGLTRRALTDQLGRRPTNAEILEIVNQVQVPSGNVDLIFPGEQITIPVGPGYDQSGVGPEIDAEGGAQGAPSGPGSASYGIPPQMQDPRPDPRTPSPGGALNQPIGGRSDTDTRRFAPPLFGAGAFDSFGGEPVGDYRDFNAGSLGDWGDLLREVVGDVGLFVGRGVGRVPLPRPGIPTLPGRPAVPTLPSGGRPALPAGGRTAIPAGSPTGVPGTPALPGGPVRPALPPGPAGGYPAAGGGRMPVQFGPGPTPRTRFPSENEIRALRQPQTRGFR